MNTALYLLLSLIDSLVVIMFMFKLYRFPLIEYTKEVLICTFTITVTSYLMRMTFELAAFDPVVQALLYMLWLRFVIKIRWPYAQLLSVTGLLGTMAIQLGVYLGLLAIGVVSFFDAQQATGLGTYVIQISGQISGVLISFLLYRFNSGFSFITAPPHDLFIRDNIKATTVIALFVANVVLYSTMYWILNSHVMYLFPIVTLTFIVLYYISYKRDNNHDRRSGRSYRI